MEITRMKRGRGRPRGTGKPDGSQLRLMADLLAADHTLRPTTAIKRTIGAQNPSTIRRLQVKWKTEGEALLLEARRRRASRYAGAAVSFDQFRNIGAEAPAAMARLNEVAMVAAEAINQLRVPVASFNQLWAIGAET